MVNDVGAVQARTLVAFSFSYLGTNACDRHRPGSTRWVGPRQQRACDWAASMVYLQTIGITLNVW